MYSKSFYITEAIGNNAFSFEKRKNKKLYVPSLVKINSFDEIKLQKTSPKSSPLGERGYDEKIAFEDYGFDGKLSTNYGLKNFYEIEWKGKPIFLFDNHNHALFFWYLAKKRGLIKEKGNILYHIDEHADYRDAEVSLEKTDLQSIFNYTNFSNINVGNYIIPAEKEGLIGKTIQIRNTGNLKDYLKNKCRDTPCGYPRYLNSPLPLGRGAGDEDIILNLDLDFFQPDLDFIDYELKKRVVLDIAKKASIITVASSPFFINQKLALKVFRDLFDKSVK